MLDKNLRARMSFWIKETRLGGGLDDASDCLKAQHSAAMVFRSANQSGKWPGIGSRILSAYMVAAANTATGDAEVLDADADHIKRVFGCLAKKLPDGIARKDLENASTMNVRLLRLILTSVSAIETDDD